MECVNLLKSMSERGVNTKTTLANDIKALIIKRQKTKITTTNKNNNN